MDNINQPNNSKHIDVLLQNSKVFADAVSQWTQRIDRIRGVYLTVLFGLVGFLLSPNSKPLKDIMSSIKADNTQIFLILLLPIFNSLLLIYIVSYMHFIYAAAKYNAYYIGKLISTETGLEILPFDDWETVVGDKEAWVTTRSIVGIMMFLIATGISFFILSTFSNAGRPSNGLLNFIVFLSSLATVSLSIIVGLVNYYVGRKYHISDISVERSKITRWYLLAIPVTGILYILIIWLM